MKTTKGSVFPCIVDTHVDQCRERLEGLMMQDRTGTDRVVRTKTRQEETFARHTQEHAEREREKERKNERTNERNERMSE